jgi:hypothetical protein
VLVHHHEAGQDTFAGQVDHRRAGWRRRRAHAADSRNLPVAHDERLIFARCGTGSVDDADVRQRHNRRVDLDVRRERVLRLLPEGSPTAFALFALRRVSP